MASCLGIYLDGNVVKYARLSIDNNNNVNVDKYGLKFVFEDSGQIIDKIIQETESYNVPVVINPTDDVYYNTQIYEQVQDKSYVPSIMKLEFESWCEKNAKSPDKYSYSYLISEAKNDENKRNAILNIATKDKINEELNTSKNIVNIYPAKPLVNRLVSQEKNSYILINIDTKLSLTVFIDGKLVEFKSYNIGMQQLLEEFTNSLGSFDKAYNMCKQMNLYTEGESTNDPSLEQIVEPIMQEILKQCLADVNRYRSSVSQIILTGIGTAFTNVDLLFSQFLDMKCLLLKPFFIKNTSDVRYISEIIEVTEAIALAYEFLNPKYSSQLQHIKGKIKLNSKIGKMVPSKPSKKEKQSKQSTPTNDVIVTDKTLDTVTYIAIVASVVTIFYIIFGIVYNISVNRMIKNMEAKEKNITETTNNVNSDISYVNKNTKEYKDVNDEVEDIKNKIESNQIGKYSTYNVASLLQNILRIIPDEVQLVKISSDDNKHIVIKASANDYEDLGYFFAQLKLENVLLNCNIASVVNGQVTTIEIGGDLP